MGSPSSPGRLRPVPEGPRCPPAVPGASDGARGFGCRTAAPGDSRMCPRAPGVNQRSRASQARLAGSRGRSPIPGDSGRCPRARRVHYISRPTRVLVQGPAVDPLSRATRAHARGHAGATRCPGRLRPGSERLRGRQAVPGSRARVRGPERSTDCPMGIEPLPKGPWGPPAVPGHSRLGPKALGVDELPQETPARLRVPAVSPSCPGDLGAIPEGLRSPPVVPGDWDRPRGPGCRRAVLGDPRVCPGTRGQPSIPGDLGWSPMSRGVDQLSRATRALFGGTAVSTSCPGRLGPRPEGPLCPPAVPCDTGPGPKARGSTSSPWRIAL